MKNLIMVLGVASILATSCGRDHTTASLQRVPDSRTTENITNNVGPTNGGESGATGVGTGSSYGSYNYGNEAAKSTHKNGSNGANYNMQNKKSRTNVQNSNDIW